MSQDKEISIIDLLKHIWRNLRLVIYIAFGCVVVGAIVAFTTPKEWRATTKVVMNSSSSGGEINSSLNRLAGLAGINLPDPTSSRVNLQVLEQVVKEDDFIFTLMDQKFYLTEINDSIQFRDYCAEYLKPDLMKRVLSVPGKIIGFLRGGGDDKGPSNTNNDYIFVSQDQSKLFEAIKDRITVIPDPQTSITQVNVVMQDPFIAAQITQYVRTFIEKYIIDLTSKEDKNLLEFVAAQLAEKKLEFEKAQTELNNFRDTNIRLVTNSSKAEEQKILNEYNMAYQLFIGMEQAYADVQIQLKKKLPIFQDLSRITVPTEAIKPKKLIILAASFFMGIVFACLYLIVRMQFESVNNEKA